MDSKNDSEKNTEQLILKAAIKEFSTKGFDGARTSTIAAEAGVTHAMLHYYFRTKEKLFERIFKDKIKYVLDMVIAPIIESDENIIDRIRKGVESHFDFLMANRELPIFFINTLNSRPELYKEVVEELSHSVGVNIRKLQTECDKAHDAGMICSVRAEALMGDIASLNVFPFLAYPMMMATMGYSADQYVEFMEARKKENVAIILKRLS